MATMNPNKFLHGKLWPEKCWHDYPSFAEKICIKCGHRPKYREPNNPTYSTMPIQDLIARLVEIGEWDAFYASSWFARKGLNAVMISQYIEESAIHTGWICQQPRFANLMLGYWDWQGELFGGKDGMS